MQCPVLHSPVHRQVGSPGNRINCPPLAQALFRKTLPIKGSTEPDTLPRSKPYKTIALGGTFDLLHKGHEQLLAKSFQLANFVLVGVTSDKFVKTLQKPHPVQKYKTRVRTIQHFLRKHQWSNRARISRLSNPYGPAATRKNLEALLVTPNTLASGRKLNRIRRRKGLPVLEIRTVRLAKAEDGKPISSTRIRKREIDRRGRITRYK